jgi:hypothetical protein
VIRAILFLIVLGAGVPCATADEWSSRNGVCYEWEGRWELQQQQPGLWVGRIDFVHVGGQCAPSPSGAAFSNEAEAVIVGGVFFARRTAATWSCVMHGTVRADGVSGYEICTGNPNTYPFAVRFRTRDFRR